MNTAANVPLGKRVGGALYFHVTALNRLANKIRAAVRLAAEKANLEEEAGFNVVKLGRDNRQMSLLYYERFFDDPFPALKRSCTIDLASGAAKQRSYGKSGNPPILHRKELLLPPDHPKIPVFKSLTQQLEAVGLFRETRRIGFAQEWQERIRAAGYEVQGHMLIALNGRAKSTGSAEDDPARHRTAINRYSLSAPMQALGRYGYLDGSWTVFDYGCGKGDDLRILEKNGVKASGWDPHFRSKAPKTAADIVNLGFVLNVIEDPSERARALHNAYALTTRLMSIAVMLNGKGQLNGEAYADGLRTSRNTFQKYYTQQELREYIQAVLGNEPIAVGPGIFLLFRDEIEEQRFLEHRSRNRSGLDRLISRIPKPTREEREQAFYNTHQDLLDHIWTTWLELGRKPEPVEVRRGPETEELFGSLGRALKFLERFHGDEAISAAFRSRKEDLTVYFALQQFEQRKPYKAMPDEQRWDIRTFFGSYRYVHSDARKLLFSAGHRDLIRQACREAASNGIGWLDQDRSLQLHTSLVEQLPAVLRVYIGCASYLYGDVTSADLIKIHIDSAKVTLMSFDDFEGKPLPRMLERVKISLRNQDIERFEYGGEYPPPYLYQKTRFVTEDFPHYAEQVAFEQKLEALNLFDFDRYGPPPQVFDEQLKAARLAVEGFQLKSTKAPCIE